MMVPMPPNMMFAQLLSQLPLVQGQGQTMSMPSRPGGITAPNLWDPGSTNAFSGAGGVFGNLFRRLFAGRTSGAMGARGPDPNAFSALARFAGPFGNGGGPIVPSFGNWMMRR